MIARRKNSTAALSKPSDAFTISGGKTVTGISCEEPQFMKLFKAQPAQDGIVTIAIFLPITRRYVHKRIAVGVPERVEIFAQEGKAFDGPIVLRERNSRLQQNSNPFVHT